MKDTEDDDQSVNGTSGSDITETTNGTAQKLKGIRRGKAAYLSRMMNEIKGLMKADENSELIRGKHTAFKQYQEEVYEAHERYVSLLAPEESDADNRTWFEQKSNDYYDFEETVKVWLLRVDESTMIMSHDEAGPSSKTPKKEFPFKGMRYDDTESRSVDYVNQLMLQQNEITRSLIKQQRMSLLPQRKVPIFDGNPLEYMSFMRSFEHTIEANTDDARDRLYFLEQYLTGAAKELVRSCMHMEPCRGLERAKTLLQKNFGNHLRLATAYIDKAISWPSIKSEDGIGLNKFALFLNSCRNAMEDIEYMEEMNHRKNLQTIVMKLPYKLRERWRTIAYGIQENGKRIRFDDLVNFIDRQSKISMDPIFGQLSDGYDKRMFKDQSTKYNKGFYQKDNFALNVTKFTDSSILKCLYCKTEGHDIDICKELMIKPHGTKIEFLKSKGRCYGCLKYGHMNKNCGNKLQCNKCSKFHPTILHIDQMELPSENRRGQSDVKDIGCAYTCETYCRDGTGEVKCALPIIPVKVKVKNGSKVVKTYAFLDSGSTASFCTDAIMNELNINGRATKLILRTMGKEKKISCDIVKGLEISSLEDDNYMDLPKLYSQNEIPVSNENIPRQIDIEKWPHLYEVLIPCIKSHVGVLIGINAPLVMQPWKVIKSRNNGPYAVKTALGWCVNGPLENPIDKICDEAHTFCATVKRIAADEKLEQTMIQQFNYEFPERIVDDKPELSIEDKLFLRKVNGSVKQNNGHFQINLPFKSGKFLRTK